MNARRLTLLALALLAGCSKTSTRPNLRLNGPSAVAVYSGFSTRDATALRHYLAVANERGDDLRVLDAVDGKAVLAPALILSLSVPTKPRPAFLAAGTLSDRDGTGAAVAGADLLVVASNGQVACDPVGHPGRTGGCVQVVVTWDAATAVDSRLTLDLASIAEAAGATGEALGATEILSLAVVPVPEPDPAAPGAFRAAAGRARLVAGVAGQRLLVADYVRATDGSGAILPDGAPALHDLGFLAVSLSGSPDLAHLYAASPDPIGAVEGVAELDLTGPAATPPAVRAIAAGAPTTLVLAARVREVTQPPDPASTASPKPDRYGPEVLRVYATLEPTRCGLDFTVACGLVVLDPALGGPAADPAGELPGRAPVAFDGEAAALAAVYPPTWGGGTIDGTAVNPPATAPPAQVALQKISTTAGFRWTSTLGALATTAGRVTLLELGTSGLVNQHSALGPTVGTRVENAGSDVIRVKADGTANPPEVGLPFLGLWDERTGTPVKTRKALDMKQVVKVTPGYTTNEAFILTWQAALPRLELVRGWLQVGAGGIAWIALQEPTGLPPPAEPLRGVGRLYDPRFGLRPGDLVQVTPDDAACPGSFELTVTALRPPDAAAPGGSVAVSGTLPSCLLAAPQAARLTFLASGLVLVGTSSGYLGRPEVDATYALRWEAEATLSCPMLQASAWPPPACDDACRTQCERLLLARKARRLAYVYEDCSGITDTALQASCETSWAHLRRPGQTVLEPNPVGPVVAFKPTWVAEDGTAPNPALPPRRGTVLRITTLSGVDGATRVPNSAGTVTGDALPNGLATFDRSATTANPSDGMRVFTSYPSNLLLDFTPSADSSTVLVYR